MSGKGFGKVSIKQVAEEAGVSVTTVSLVLNGKGRISDKTARHVKKIAQNLGFTPNQSAVRLRSGKSKLIGCIVNDFSNPFFGELSVALESEAFGSGYLTVIANSHDDIDRQGQLIDSMAAHGVSGFIICPAIGSSSAAFESIREKSIPYVICVRDIDDDNATFVGGDDYQSGVLAAEHLIGKGHKKIALVGGAPGLKTWERRTNGFMNTANSHDIFISGDMIFKGPATREFGIEVGKNLADQKTDVTAIFCYNDIIAVGMCASLNIAGFQVGNDIAVMGVDNLPETTSWIPPLTTIEMYPKEVGRRSAQALIESLKTKNIRRERILLIPKLLARGSTQKPLY